MVAVDGEGTDVQHGEVSWELLEQRAAACIPHLGGQGEQLGCSGTSRGQRSAVCGLTMVELEASSPAHTSIPAPPGLLNTAFFVSSLQDEPALKV